MKITQILLYPDPQYTLQVTLDSASFSMRFYTNTRTSIKHFDIFDTFDNPIVQGIALLPNALLLDTLDLSSAGISGVFFLSPKNGEIVFEELLTESLPEYYEFFYLSE